MRNTQATRMLFELHSPGRRAARLPACDVPETPIAALLPETAVAEARVDTAGHTELEQRLMTQHRWFTLAELESWHEAVFPVNLADMIRSQIAT